MGNSVRKRNGKKRKLLLEALSGRLLEEFTGRSPDGSPLFVKRDEITEDKVWWGKY